MQSTPGSNRHFPLLRQHAKLPRIQLLRPVLAFCVPLLAIHEQDPVFQSVVLFPTFFCAHQNTLVALRQPRMLLPRPFAIRHTPTKTDKFVRLFAVLLALHLVRDMLAVITPVHAAENHNVLAFVSQSHPEIHQITWMRPVVRFLGSSAVRAFDKQARIADGLDLLIIANHQEISIPQGLIFRTVTRTQRLPRSVTDLPKEHAADHTALVKNNQLASLQPSMQRLIRRSFFVQRRKRPHAGHRKRPVRRRCAKLHLERSRTSRCSQHTTAAHRCAISSRKRYPLPLPFHDGTNHVRFPRSSGACADHTSRLELELLPFTMPCVTLLTLRFQHIVQEPLPFLIELIYIRYLNIIIHCTASPQLPRLLPFTSMPHGPYIRTFPIIRRVQLLLFSPIWQRCRRNGPQNNLLRTRWASSTHFRLDAHLTPLASFHIAIQAVRLTKRWQRIIFHIHSCARIFFLRSCRFHFWIIIRILAFVIRQISVLRWPILVTLLRLLRQQLLMQLDHLTPHIRQQSRIAPELPRQRQLRCFRLSLSRHRLLQRRIQRPTKERIPTLVLLSYMSRHPLDEHRIDEHLHERITPTTIELGN